MKLRRCISVVLAALCLVAFGGCRRHEDAKADFSTPRKAVATLIGGINSRNPDQIKQCFVAESAAYAQALASLLKASQALQDAAADRFGKQDAKVLAAMEDQNTDLYRRFDAEAEEKITGETATLTSPTKQAVRLRKESGQWRIVGEIDGEGKLIDTAAATRILTELAGALDAIAADIKDRSKSIDLKEARRRMGESVSAIVRR